MTNFHRDLAQSYATAALNGIDLRAERPIDPITAARLAQVAAVHALLALGDEVREVADQLKLANVMTSQAPRDECGNPAVSLSSWEDSDAAWEYQKEAVTRIVKGGEGAR